MRMNKLGKPTEIVQIPLRLSPSWAICIVFLSNFCILVIEIIAGRLMAPIVGVSLYTWTSIIGVILAGISLGNYLGGKIADRWAISNMAPSVRYDLIVGDAFNDFSVPFHLTTLEFNQLVAGHLSDRGLYMINIIDGKQGAFLRAYIHTLEQVFAHVHLASVDGNVGDKVRQTYVIVASQQPIEQVTTTETLANNFITPIELQSYLDQAPAVLLTDDYVPVDNLLAPVFADSGL